MPMKTFISYLLFKTYRKFIHIFILDALKGRVIWITGASTGIGAACAVEAAKVGAKLVLTARNEELLKETRQKCLGKFQKLSLISKVFGI